MAAVSEGLQEVFEETPTWVALFTMISYAILFVLGHIRDFLISIRVIKNGSSKESSKLKVGIGDEARQTANHVSCSSPFAY